MNRKINAEGLALVKRWESLRLNAYLCPANVPTIGYGHTGDVKLGDRITAHQADVILDLDLERVAGIVEGLAPAANENEFSALVSFAFNVGTNALGKSTLLALHNRGLKAKAADEFRRWVYAKTSKGMEVLPGLVRRREAERALYLKPVEPVLA